MASLLPTPDRGADLSPCGRYRYRLWRRWGSGDSALFVMLNPSTADADIDDPTIRRCIGFARRWGFGGLEVVNLYGARATDPDEIDAWHDPIGRDNDRAILDAAARAALLVCAWGATVRRLRFLARGLDREREVLDLLAGHRLHCLGTTKGGHPRHPLYVRGDVGLVPLR